MPAACSIMDDVDTFLYHGHGIRIQELQGDIIFFFPGIFIIFLPAYHLLDDVLKCFISFSTDNRILSSILFFGFQKFQ